MARNNGVISRLFGWLKPEHKALLLSHHIPKDYSKRTIVVNFFEVSLRLCSRCLGTYSALVTCLLLALSPIALHLNSWLLLATTLPAVALIDWSLSRVNRNFGNRYFRLASGFLLGLGYFAWLVLFLENPINLLLWLVALAYSTAAGFVLILTPNESGNFLYT